MSKVKIEETGDPSIFSLVVDAQRRKWRVHLYFIGDIHIGSAMNDPDSLATIVDVIRRDPYAVWIGTGDYADYIGPGDPRFSPAMLRYDDRGNPIVQAWHYIQWQTEEFIEQVEPIKEKNILLLLGNHELSALKKPGTPDIIKILSENGYRVGGYEAFLRLNIRSTSAKGPRKDNDSKTLDIYASHGFGGGRKHGSSVNRLMEKASDYAAQLYVMGHVEKGNISISGYMARGRKHGERIFVPQVFMVLPAYKKFGSYDDIAEDFSAVPFESRVGKPVESIPMFRVVVTYGSDKGKSRLHVESFPDIRQWSSQELSDF